MEIYVHVFKQLNEKEISQKVRYLNFTRIIQGNWDLEKPKSVYLPNKNDISPQGEILFPFSYIRGYFKL